MSYYEDRYVDKEGRVRGGTVARDALKWGAVLFVVVLALGIVGTYSGLVGSWFRVPAQIYSPENVKKQWDFAYTYDESLQATARNVCIAGAGVKNATTDAERVARNSQLLAIEQNYSRIEGEYNAALRNAFEAGLVRPPDVPDRAPTLSQMMAKVGCS